MMTAETHSHAHTVAPSGGSGGTLGATIIRRLKHALHSLIGPETYDKIGRALPRRSETGRYRALLAPYCEGNGVDIGFGGDAITPAALRMDLPSPYTRVGSAPLQLAGDCRNLHWFRDGSLDYVYSSHVLEDFGESETAKVLAEWTRVLRVGGRLVLLLPDQQRYLAFCRRRGLVSPVGIVGNAHHSVAHFSLGYVDTNVSELGNLKRIAAYESLGPYSFAVVYEKER